jgi:hypothetical protein
MANPGPGLNHPFGTTISTAKDSIAGIDGAGYEYRISRSEFTREAMGSYLECLRAQNDKINVQNEEALVA